MVQGEHQKWGQGQLTNPGARIGQTGGQSKPFVEPLIDNRLGRHVQQAQTQARHGPSDEVVEEDVGQPGVQHGPCQDEGDG